MIYVIASLSIVAFMVALVLLRIVPIATEALNTGRAVMSVLSDADLDDDYKENALQQASISLLCKFVSITLRGIAALGFAYLLIYLADFAGVADMQAVIDLLSTWQVIVAATIVLTMAWFLGKKWLV